MENKINSLINEYIKHKNISTEPKPDLVKYLLTFTRNKDFVPVSPFLNAKYLKDKSEEAYTTFTGIKDLTDGENKLIRFLIKTSELRKFHRKKIACSSKLELENRTCGSLKKVALGFKDEYFNESGIYKLKMNLEKHIFEMIFQIYQYGCIYSRLKNIVDLNSKSFLFFNDVIKEEIVEYEEMVLGQRNDVKAIDFYVYMWKEFNKLSVLNQLHDFFMEHPKQPFKIQHYFKNNPVVNKILKRCFYQIQANINEFINTGNFNDVFNEFFISKNTSPTDLWNAYTIDFGLLPACVSKENAGKILYIGKCVFLLNQNEDYFLTNEINANCNFFESDLNRIILEVNANMHERFIARYQVQKYILFAKDVFLHYRSDFIETLYAYLKNSNKSSDRYLHGKSISYSLENAFRDTFGEINDFAKQIDICILENEHAWDYITLFCKLEYPLNLIFTKEIIMKYVSVFKFLWRIKKLFNSLCQLKRKEFNSEGRIRIIIYINLLSSLYSYVFEDVINAHYKTDMSVYKMIIDDLRKSINKSLDQILDGIFQTQGMGKEEIDAFLSSLETLCISVSRINVNSVSDAEVSGHLKAFILKNCAQLKKSTLSGIISHLN